MAPPLSTMDGGQAPFCAGLLLSACEFMGPVAISCTTDGVSWHLPHPLALTLPSFVMPKYFLLWEALHVTACGFTVKKNPKPQRSFLLFTFYSVFA